MKLRSPFLPQQLLFQLVLTLFLLVGSAVFAQDTVIMRTGAQQQFKVLGVTGSNVMVKTQFGEQGLPLVQVKEVRLAAVPPQYNASLAAFQAKDYNKALGILQPLMSKWRGLPAPWAEQATAMLGDVHVELGDLAKAEAAYKQFQQLYPGSALADIGIAAMEVNKKDYAAATKRLDPVTTKALEEKNVPYEKALAYSKAFYLSGQAKEAEGNLAGALEDYLRTVTLFYHDRASVALAQEKADALRKANKDLIVP
jgi:outer membrane protein assembly factor BamD (BamD/ComL family)